MSSQEHTATRAQGYHVDPAIYDASTANVTADIAPHVAMMRAANGPAIEVCCGNGRLLIPTLEAGVPCEGLDFDAPMLDDLRAKLAAKGLTATIHHADMRDFSLPNRYALMVIPFNSFLHNLTQKDQLDTLRCCRAHLEEGGRLAIVAFHPSVPKLMEYAGAETLMTEAEYRGGRVRIWDRADDDRIEQIRHMSRRVETWDAAGTLVGETRYTFDMRYVFKPEMELLLRVAGFARWDVRPLFADYRDASSAAGDRPMREGDNLLWTAWKS